MLSSSTHTHTHTHTHTLHIQLEGEQRRANLILLMKSLVEMTKRSPKGKVGVRTPLELGQKLTRRNGFNVACEWSLQPFSLYTLSPGSLLKWVV